MAKAVDKERAERLKWEQKASDAGQGVYFRNSDKTQVYVEVSFYPKRTLFMCEDGGRRRITDEELVRDYFRLRLK